MKQYLSINIADRTATLVGGSTWTPPELTLGDDLTLALRFEKTIDGQTVEASVNVAALFAAIGEIDAPPTQGKAAIKVGLGAQSVANTTAEVPFNASAGELQTAFNALTGPVATYGTAKVWRAEGSYLIRFGAGVQVPLLVVDNTLWPISFGRVSAYQLDGQWIHEIRFQQAPGAFTDAAPRVLPPPPVIARVRAGATVDDEIVSEIQSLTIAREFRGAYDLTFNFGRTDLLSQEDGPEEIAGALKEINAGFEATLPLSGVVNIEFGGELAGLPQPLLEVAVRQAPEGDLTLTLGTRRAVLAAMLRTQAKVTLPLHIRLNILEDGVVKDVVALRQDVTIHRPLIWDDLATVANIDWLQPPSPKDYIPYTLDQVLIGQQQAFPATIGNGSATEFPVAHNLNSPVCSVVVVEVATGRMLRDNEFTVIFTNANSLVISSFAATPTVGEYQALIIGIGPASAFQSHTHTMDQIGGLLNYLSSLNQRVTILENILPGTGAAGTTNALGGLKIKIPGINTTLFFKGDQAKEFDPEELPLRPPFLLPAVHDATVAALPDPLPAFAAGSVWQNTGGVVLVPGGGQTPSSKVAAGGYVASDGRLLYEAVRGGATNSYYPRAFEKTLFTLEINDKMLRLNGTLEVQFAVVAQILRAGCQAQWVVVIETGSIAAETTPAPIGFNLQQITWSATPILAQRILLSELEVKHAFGVRLKRSLVSLVDKITADRMLYGVWEGANTLAPATANFALRARLTQFDTENIADPRGWLHYALVGVAAEGEDSADEPKATINY